MYIITTKQQTVFIQHARTGSMDATFKPLLTTVYMMPACPKQERVMNEDM